MKCDRCKAELATKTLTLAGEDRSTTKNLCAVCMDAARTFWGHFLAGYKMQKAKDVNPEPTGDMTDESLMYFGQYKGHKMKNVPASYLLYIADQPWIEKFGKVLKYINKNRQGLEDEVAEQGDD